MIARELSIPTNRDFFLFGPRQTGKTSLIERKFNPDSIFPINLFDNETYLRYLGHPQILSQEINALSPQITHIFIDEVQRVPELLNEVQIQIDKRSSRKFILTGSSARKLKKIQANLLGGRAWNLNLFPFTSHELGASFNLPRALQYGTLPRIYLADSDRDREEYLRSYLEIYIEQEIKAEALARNLTSFTRFLNIAAQQNAEQINFSAIAKDTGASRQSVQNYFAILEDTLIGKILLPYHHSERKRHKLAPKFYFFDTGVYHVIQQKLKAPLLPGTYEFGIAFETFMINEIFRINSYQRKDWKIGFLRTVNDVEVDIVIETPNAEVIGIEIKSKELPHELDFSSGQDALKRVVPKASFYCACSGSTKRLVRDAHIWPFQDVLEMLRKL